MLAGMDPDEVSLTWMPAEDSRACGEILQTNTATILLDEMMNEHHFYKTICLMALRMKIVMPTRIRDDPSKGDFWCFLAGGARQKTPPTG